MRQNGVTRQRDGLLDRLDEQAGGQYIGDARVGDRGRLAVADPGGDLPHPGPARRGRPGRLARSRPAGTRPSCRRAGSCSTTSTTAASRPRSSSSRNGCGPERAHRPWSGDDGGHAHLGQGGLRDQGPAGARRGRSPAKPSRPLRTSRRGSSRPSCATCAKRGWSAAGAAAKAATGWPGPPRRSPCGTPWWRSTASASPSGLAPSWSGVEPGLDAILRATTLADLLTDAAADRVTT